MRLSSLAYVMSVSLCVISFTTIRPWALISLLSQLDAAAPESSYPLVSVISQLASLSQLTFVEGFYINILPLIRLFLA